LAHRVWDGHLSAALDALRRGRGIHRAAVIGWNVGGLFHRQGHAAQHVWEDSAAQFSGGPRQQHLARVALPGRPVRQASAAYVVA
jgi:hypothetical protein